MNDLTRAIESETREFAVQSGGPDLLAGECLFCVVAIRQNRISHESALALTKPSWKDLLIIPGARCPSYARPMSNAQSTAAANDRDITLDDIWTALSEYDSDQFAALCSLYRLTEPSA